MVKYAPTFSPVGASISTGYDVNMQNLKLRLTPGLRSNRNDRVFAKAFNIAIGGLIGGGIAYYWKETHLVDGYRRQLEELEEELHQLNEIRKAKEKLWEQERRKQASSS